VREAGSILCGGSPKFHTPDFMATLCPPDDIVSEAENILKTKGQGTAFLKNEAENILKQSPLQ
jgi:hypothetical protein